jgi:hypothetical protein
MPSLLDLDPQSGELRVGTDFRRVYAAVLENWLGLGQKVPRTTLYYWDVNRGPLETWP